MRSTLLLAAALAGCASAGTPGAGDDDGGSGAVDARVDVPPDACLDTDGDGACDAVDACPGHDDRVDTDADTVADGCDLCPMADDRVDVNANMVPDCSELQMFSADVKVVGGNYWRGWYAPSSGHMSTNDNTMTGLYDNQVYNSYFVFTLPSLTATTVASVTLELEVHTYAGDAATETLSVWDVSTAPGTLETSAGNATIHADLMTGATYGTYALSAADVGPANVVSIPLATQAATDVRLRLGSDFAVGLHNDTAPGNFRFSQAAEARVARLVVQYLP